MSDLDRLVRRLRTYTPRAWRGERRSESVRDLAKRLAAIGADGRELPDLPDYALPDVIAVLGADALDADPDRTNELLRTALVEIR